MEEQKERENAHLSVNSRDSPFWIHDERIITHRIFRPKASKTMNARKDLLECQGAVAINIGIVQRTNGQENVSNEREQQVHNTQQ